MAASVKKGAVYADRMGRKFTVKAYTDKSMKKVIVAANKDGKESKVPVALFKTTHRLVTAAPKRAARTAKAPATKAAKGRKKVKAA